MMIVQGINASSVKTFVITMKNGQVIHVSAVSFTLAMENVYRFFMEPIDEVSKKLNKNQYCRTVFEIKAKEVFSVGEEGTAKWVKSKKQKESL